MDVEGRFLLLLFFLLLKYPIHHGKVERHQIMLLSRTVRLVESCLG